MFSSKLKNIFIFVILLTILFSIRGVQLLIKGPVFPKPFFTYATFLNSNKPDGYINIYNGHTLGQEAVLKFPNLCKLGILVLQDKAGENSLILHIKESPNNPNDILTMSAKKSDLFNKYYPFVLPEINIGPKASVYFFQFQPLSYPIGKSLYFFLDSPDSNQDNGIKVGYYTNKYRRGFTGGPTYLDGVICGRYLAFCAYNWWDGFISKVLKEIMNKMLLDLHFMIFYFILCSSLLLCIFLVNNKLRILKQ